MRHIIQIPIEKDYEKHDMLFHYDLLAIVINRVLGKIMDKIKKDIQMTNADKFTNYELSYTLFMIV
jgi:DNA-binding FadR family transcriptional regulator